MSSFYLIAELIVELILQQIKKIVCVGTFWTAASHIITAVIGSGVLSLAWAIAQLGWVVGPIVLILFAFANLYSSNLLAQCYRTGDPVTGHRNYTYTDAVKSNLGNSIDCLQCILSLFQFISYSNNICRRKKGNSMWFDSVLEYVWCCNWLHNSCISQHDVSSSTNLSVELNYSGALV